MNLNWSNRVIKYVLFVFNLLFVITGIVMIAVGVSVKSYYTDYDIFLDNRYFSLPNLLIATGALIFFISFFGCCGAIKESWFMIFIFSILLSLIFILEFSAGIAGYVLRDKTSQFLTDELTKSMDKYVPGTEKPDVQTRMWDEIQSTFQCCGAKGPDDWKGRIKPTSMTTSSSTPTTPGSQPTTTTTQTPNPTSTPSSIVTSPPSSTILSTASSTDIPTNLTKPGAESLIADDDPGLLPASCCRSKPGATGTTTCSLTDNSTTILYQTGCVEGFGRYLKEYAVTIGGVGLAIGFIQLFGVIFACHLAKQLKHGFYST